MELQLSTTKAEDAIDKIERSLESLRASLDKTAQQAEKFGTFTAGMGSVKGVNPQATTSVNSLGAAVKGLDPSKLSQMSAKLSDASTAGEKAGRQTRTLAAALAALRTPPTLGQTAAGMHSVSSAAKSATSSVNGLNNSLKTTHTVTSQGAAGIGTLTQQYTKNASSARSAGQATAYFGTAAGNLRAGLAAVGIAALGRELGQFVQASYNAQVSFDKFNAIMNNTTGPGTAAKQFEFLRKVSTDTATSLEDNMEMYSKFAQASISSGFSAKDTGDMFLNSAIAVRGFGLSAENAKGAMLALQQMMTKGKINAEDMNQQLLERGVPAMAALSQATGKTTEELTKMMQAGKLGRAELQLMITEMGKIAAPAVAEQLKTIGAQMQIMANNWTMAKLAFSDTFFPSIVAGMQALNAAFSSSTGVTFFQTLGTVAGAAINAILYGIAMLTPIVMGFVNAWYVVIQGFQEAYNVLASGFLGEVVAKFTEMTGGAYSLADAMHMLGVGLAAATGAWIAYRAVLLTALAAKVLMTVLMSKWVIIIGLVIGAIAGLSGNVSTLAKKLIEVATETSTAAGTFNKLSGDAKDAAAALLNTKEGANGASDGLSNVDVSAGGASSSMYGASTSAYSLGDAFGDVAVNANNAASAIQNANAAAASAPSGGGGGGGSSGGGGVHDGFGPDEWASGYSEMWEKLGTGDFSSNGFSQWRDGGIVGKGNRSPTRKLPLSAFAGAPRFATGGTTEGLAGSLPDGGIPSILHPNEAVIPLAGGAVPVQLSGTTTASSGGSGSAGLTVVVRAFEKGFAKTNSLLTEINKSSAMIKENVNQVGVIFKMESDRQLAVMNTQTGLLTDMVTKIEAMRKDLTAMKTTGSYGGSGGGVGGSGGSSGSAYSGDWTSADEKEWQAMLKEQENANRLWGSITQGGGRTARFGAKGASKNVQARLAAEGLGETKGGGSFGGWGGSGLNTNYTSDNYGKVEGANSGSMLGDYFENQLKNNPAAVGGGGFGSSGGGIGFGSGISGFSRGSPNVLDEAMGRSAVVRVHEDEAVVPLPDGRRVPVDLSGMDLPHGGGGGGRNGSSGGGGGGGGRQIVVNMTVNAQDADSFRASEDQIYQRMQQKLDRAIKNLGTASSIDDPTVRPGSR
jgi:tape measure domain-containing protein